MPTTAEVTQARLRVCRACPEWAGGCRLGHDVSSLSGCPQNKFCGYYGVGSAIAKVAKPIARAVGLIHCAACARREDRYNHFIARR